MTEEWREIPGHSGYEVSNTGFVRSWWKTCGSGRSRREIPIQLKGKTENGYIRVTVSFLGQKRLFFVHHLVLEIFHSPRPEGMWCLHRDGVRSNNRLENLYWGSPTENCEDRDKHGRAPKREANPNVKLTEDEVSEIRRRYVRGVVRQVDIASDFGITQTQVSSIILNKNWTI